MAALPPIVDRLLTANSRRRTLSLACCCHSNNDPEPHCCRTLADRSGARLLIFGYSGSTGSCAASTPGRRSINRGSHSRRAAATRAGLEVRFSDTWVGSGRMFPAGGKPGVTRARPEAASQAAGAGDRRLPACDRRRGSGARPERGERRAPPQAAQEAQAEAEAPGPLLRDQPEQGSADAGRVRPDGAGRHPLLPDTARLERGLAQLRQFAGLDLLRLRGRARRPGRTSTSSRCSTRRPPGSASPRLRFRSTPPPSARRGLSS